MEDPTETPTQKVDSVQDSQDNFEPNFNHQFDTLPSGEEFVVDNGKGNLISGNMEANINYYPPPNMFVGPQTMHVQSTVVTNQPLALHEWIRFPMNGVMCMNCHRFCTSDVRESFKSSAYAWAFLLCCFSGIFCAFIPFLRKDMKKTEHFCPFCRSKLGVYSPEMKTETKVILALALILGLALTGVAIYLMVVFVNPFYN